MKTREKTKGATKKVRKEPFLSIIWTPASGGPVAGWVAFAKTNSKCGPSFPWRLSI